jgi:hypothetical protein
MAAANPDSPVADRPKMTEAHREESPVLDDGSGARDLRLGLIILGVPALVAVALGIILSLT